MQMLQVVTEIHTYRHEDGYVIQTYLAGHTPRFLPSKVGISLAYVIAEQRGEREDQETQAQYLLKESPHNAPTQGASDRYSINGGHLNGDASGGLSTLVSNDRLNPQLESDHKMAASITRFKLPFVLIFPRHRRLLFQGT
jgi:hypothetical protein